MPFPIYDNQEDIPEAFRDEYEEREGKWHPKVPNVENLNSAIEKERTRAENEEKARKKAERELAEERRKKAAAEHGITDEQLQKLRQEDADARKPLEDELAKVKSENRKLKLDDKVRLAALDAGIFPEDIELAMLEVSPRFDLTEQGSIVVLDKNKEPTTKTPKQFFEDEYRKLRPKFYQSSGASGSGANGSGGGGGDNAQQPSNQDQLAAKRQQVAGAL